MDPSPRPSSPLGNLITQLMKIRILFINKSDENQVVSALDEANDLMKKLISPVQSPLS